jgi:hypothetical protein
VQGIGAKAGLDPDITLERLDSFIATKFAEHAHYRRVTGGLLKKMVVEDFEDLLELDQYKTPTHETLPRAKNRIERLLEKV